MAALPRSRTDLQEVETTPFAHKYLLKRPRMMQRSTTSSISLTNTLSRRTTPIPLNAPAHDRHPSLPEGPNIDNPAVEKRKYLGRPSHGPAKWLNVGRFELFIDLIWVGIISNLAERFSDAAFSLESTSNAGENVFEFIATFLIAWRIWKDLQEYMTKYHTNDLVERLFVLWIIILAMLYGNNASYLFNGPESSNMAILIYLVIQGSFVVVETAYSVYIPPLRKQLALRGALLVLVLPLWIPAIFLTYPTRAGLIFAAIVMGYWTAAFMTTPLAERILKQDHSESFDADHWVERIQDFYIIVLGEGVLSLIKGSPLGKGITYQAGTGVLALLAYYVLSAFYFNGDQSRKYVHAVRRTWWRRLLWLT